MNGACHSEIPQLPIDHD